MRLAPVRLQALALVVAWTTVNAHAPAQQQATTGSERPASQQPKPKPKPPVVDPTEAAAEILRRRLGLRPGPVGAPPPGPPPPEPITGPPGTPVETPDTLQEPDRSTKPTTPPGQDPKPAIDPTQQAAKAIQRLLPNATTPPIAPIQNKHGTPESIPAIPAPDPTQQTSRAANQAAETAGLSWSGLLSTRYRLRHGGGASDHDLVTRLGVDFGRAEDPLSLHLRGRAFVNIDGQRQDDPFPGLDNSFGDDVNARLYAAHLDMTRVPGFALVRLGRQDLDETPAVLSFDGVRADTQRFGGPSRGFVTGYVGVPVHQFEASSSGDFVVGIGGGFVPWQHARVRLDFMHLRDEFFAIDRQDTLLSMRWWQGLGEHVQLSGLHTFRDGDARDLKLSALGDLGDDTDFRISYRELLSTQRIQVSDLDPFYLVASEYSPYRQIELSLTHELSKRLVVSAGSDIRRLTDRNDERTFNREFEHVWADATLRDVLVPGLSATIAGNLWDSSGEDSRALTGELLYRPDHDLRVSLGVGYDLFRYDLLQQRERIRVRSYYLRCDRRVGDAVRLDVGYELQRDDIDEFHLFRMGLTWTF